MLMKFFQAKRKERRAWLCLLSFCLGSGILVQSNHAAEHLYRLRRSWSDVASQAGAYVNLDYAIRAVHSLKGYQVYDEGGKQVYPSRNQASSQLTLPFASAQEGRSKAGQQSYTVKAGDSWWSIARQFGLNYLHLAQANNCGPRDIIYPGDQLVIPSSKASPSTSQASGQGTRTSDTQIKTAASSPSQTQQGQTYTVQAGDSFWAIGRRFNIPYTLICQANHLQPNSLILPGMSLKIPQLSSPKEQAKASSPSPAPNQAASAPSQASSSEAKAKPQEKSEENAKGDKPSSPAKAAQASSAQIDEKGNRRTVYGWISPEELDLYLGMVAAEAGGSWGYDGVLMIAQVMVNRVLREGSSMQAVLSAPGQFTPYKTGAWRNRQLTGERKQAALDALDGKTAFGRNVYYFCTRTAYNASSWWQSLNKVATYENTVFCAAK